MESATQTFKIIDRRGEMVADQNGNLFYRSTSTLVKAGGADEALEKLGYVVSYRLHNAYGCVRASAVTRGVAARVWV